MTPHHVSNSDLIRAASGELDRSRETAVRTHLESCWECRARSQEIEAVVTDFVRTQQESVKLPNAAGPRALLRARLAELAQQEGPRPARTQWWFAAAAVLGVLFLTMPGTDHELQARVRPDPRLTPGATLMVSDVEVCRGDTASPHVIPASVGREVFGKYGIKRPPARAYELDYLIDPELGGADDPRNYWPQPYAASDWNAHVKDALEDHLRELVCMQQLSLAEAQREIASDWISAYKKYFQTDRPIASHRGFTKDQPWQP